MNRRASFLAIVLALAASPAWAQQTGGRFGGANWGAANNPPPAAPPPSLPPPPAMPSAPPPVPGVPPALDPPPSLPAAPPVAVPAPPPPAPVLATDYRRPSPYAGRPVEAPPPRVTEDESSLTHPALDTSLRYGPPRAVPGLVAGAITFGLLAGLSLFVSRRRSEPAAPRLAPGVAPSGPAFPVAPPREAHPGFEVRRVTVALDWTARAQVQAALARVAASVPMNTPEGLHAGAVAARDVVAGAHASARYGAFQSFPLDASRAEQTFGQLADHLRNRYTVETISNARRVTGVNVQARADEGGGLVVVSLLVAVKGALPPLPATVDLPGLMAALSALVPPRADRLIALEVVWSPAEDTDRMSSAELQVLYPELLPLDPGAALGRRACPYCRAVYARELGRCPACGAAAS